jgi:hypothetical protein
MKIIRGRLSASDVTPTSLRWNPDTNTVQQTPDGGATWIDTPTLDPRAGTGYKLPARTSSDPRCDAAENMVVKLQSMVGIFEADLAQLQAVNAIVDIVLVFLPEVGIVIEALLAAVEFLLTIGADVISAAFTDDQWQIVRCILYCDIASDGTVDQARFDKILDDMHAQASTVVYDVLYTIFTLSLGVNGVSNAGATGDAVGDCSECVCGWCYHFDASSGFADWTGENFAGAVSTWDGTQWVGALEGDTFVVWVSLAVSGAPTFTDAAITAVTGDGNRAIFLNGDGSAFSGTNVWQDGFVTPGTLPFDSVTRIDLYHLTAHDSNVQAIQSCQFSGIGDNPFGTDNC